MPTTFTKALELSNATAGVIWGHGSAATPAALDNMASFTTIELVNLADGLGYKWGLFKGDGADGGWYHKMVEQFSDNHVRYYSTMARVTGGYARTTYPTFEVGQWGWVATQWDRAGSAFTVYGGPYNGAVAAAVVTANEGDGSGATKSDSDYPLFFGDRDGNGNAPVGTKLAFLGVWAGLLSLATIQSYCADMEATGKATALLYAKVTETDTVALADKSAAALANANDAINATYGGTITLVDGPDIAEPPPASPSGRGGINRGLIR